MNKIPTLEIRTEWVLLILSYASGSNMTWYGAASDQAKQN